MSLYVALAGDPVERLAALLLTVRLEREAPIDPMALHVLVLHREAGPEWHVALHVPAGVAYLPTGAVARGLELDPIDIGHQELLSGSATVSIT